MMHHETKRSDRGQARTTSSYEIVCTHELSKYLGSMESMLLNIIT
jgi:hypothetical protein